MEQIQIHSLTNEFLGVGISPNGRSISYPYTLPGDVVSVELIKKKSRPGRYRLVDFIEKVSRSEVKCDHFTECGGCAGQHIPYLQQCNLKFEPIIKLFSDQLGISFETITASEIFNYRSRMDFSVFPGPTVGLRARGNFRRVIAIEDCKIQSEWANLELKQFNQLINDFPHYPWDRRSENGGLKYITIRKSIFTDDNISILTFTEGFQNQADFQSFKELTLKYLTANNIILCYNRVKSEVSAMGRSEILRGKETFLETISGINFEIPFDSFFQPNPLGFLPIIQFIENKLPENKSTFTDLFCGNGFFSILLGSDFSTIRCYEQTPSSIQIAKNGLLKRFPKAQIEASVVNLFQDLSGLVPDLDGVLILDPPRAGAGSKVNQWLKEFGPKDIFYVSCNPYSQLEDVKQFLSSYHPISALLIDPYPHTPHCESVIHFQRKV